MTSVNTNIGAQVAQKNMLENSRNLDQAMNRLSSGKRINSAADDAAGSAIASKMEAQVRSLSVAIRNANDAISLTQTAEGALSEIENMLQRMRELAVQAGNSTLNASDRAQIQDEVNQLSAEIDSIAATTHFNGNKLLSGDNKSLTFQIGPNEADAMGVVLQDARVSALGVGSSVTSSSITSERIKNIDADIAAADIKINGQNFSAAAIDVNSTSAFDGDGRLDGTFVDDTDNSENGGKSANVLAQAINTNSHKHGAVATAFNKVVSNGTFSLTGDLKINDVTLSVGSATSIEDFVKKINDNVSGVTASLEGTVITLQNDDGDQIKVENSSGEFGIADDTYGGYVSISNIDGSNVKMEAGSTENGYGSSAAGEQTDLNSIGFNEINGTTVRSTLVTSSALAASDNVTINGVAIGDSASSSAADKALAINNANAGVTASAKTIVRATIAVDEFANTDDLAINGITADISGDASLGAAVTTINTALLGKSDVVATVNNDGELVLTSASGQNIDIETTNGASFITAAVSEDGIAISVTSGELTAYGNLTLSSDDGGVIVLEDGEVDTHTGLAKLGLMAQSEDATTVVSGLGVSTTQQATAALTSLDDAIDKVSRFRSSFGAYENRFDAAINNLTTLKVNMEATQSRIEDANFAAETSNLTKNQILNQAATSMLAQANASKQNLLALLQ